MYIYKSTQHIPVAGEPPQILDDKEKLSKTERNIEDILESKDKEPKKRKKKIVKKRFFITNLEQKKDFLCMTDKI